VVTGNQTHTVQKIFRAVKLSLGYDNLDQLKSLVKRANEIDYVWARPGGGKHQQPPTGQLNNIHDARLEPMVDIIYTNSNQCHQSMSRNGVQT
jgi:hypothetical protein